LGNKDRMMYTKRMLLLLVLSSICSIGTAEMRTWNFKTGETIEAEYVKTMFDNYVIKDANGKEYTIPIAKFNLSDDDKEYLALENPPKLALEIRKSVVRKNYSMVRGSENRPPEQRGNFGVLIKQKSPGDYPYPLTVEVYVFGDEIKGDRYILLDRFSSPFSLREGPKSKFEYYSNRTVRLTDMWGTEPYAGVVFFTRRGEQYSGFMIVVKDKRGKVIAVDASNEWMPEHLETLEQRRIGNYMDETFQRTYPTRPRSDWSGLQIVKDRY